MTSTKTAVPFYKAWPGGVDQTTQSLATSGDTSGLGDLSGPWFIETQSLNYNYLRVPIGSVSSMSVGLSSITMEGKIDKTVLLIIADCNYTAVSSNTFFATSSFQQAQDFIVQSVSADANGETYGSSLAVGAFGPRGRVITDHPYYSRKPYVEGRDIIQTQSSRGAMNFVAVSVSSNNGVSIPVILNEYQSLEDLMTPEHAHSWNTMMGAKGTLLGVESQPQLGLKFGGYSVQLDTIDDVRVTTDEIGRLFKDGHLTDGAGRPAGTEHHGAGMHNVSVNMYDYTHHNWT